MATELDLADAQLRGYFHAKHGHSLMELIESMGLKRSEWQDLNEHTIPYMNTTEIEEVNEYFEKLKNQKQQ